MQIVIDIDEEIFNKLPEAELGSNVIEDVLEAVENGTVLPKGHGDLIDRNKIEYLKAIHDAKYGYITWSDAIARIRYSAPTIIEADKR